MKTTIMLRDDLYAFLVERFGKRRISEGVNKMLFEHVFEEKKQDFFGVDPWLKKAGVEGLRDEHDRNL
ncbi:hypothetical protein H0N96_00340 [Candidatus Micrarchaeota archaeon]|nr:hypothetical protein [Candidatus Micrarchaeota archaeon]